MKQYINVMEEVVESLVTFMLQSPDYRLFCKCEKCKTDIIAYSLNNLPPHYVTTEEGRKNVFENLNTDKNREWVNKRIISAIHLVHNYPKH
ncbi:late competence development ComFB family protein [Neobacillus muris]|uniref:late competence development ComFB family protein n=1 Tax=Neobacillus muris TaxID=2941334 RepID=UPI002040FBAD|nr:late competence development ComFB family protein [Neobacillus muris]